MKGAIALAVLAGVLLLAAAPAVADDASVYRAYVSMDPQFAHAGDRVQAAVRRWKRSHGARSKSLVSALDSARGLIAQLVPTVTNEQPSSTNGATGKSYALKSLSELDRSMALLVQAAPKLRHHPRAADRLGRRADREIVTSGASECRARKAFKRAGVKLKYDPDC